MVNDIVYIAFINKVPRLIITKIVDFFLYWSNPLSGVKALDYMSIGLRFLNIKQSKAIK